MVGAQLNKFIFSLTITNKIKLLWYNDLETTYRLFKIDNLGKIIIFKKIANYAESLPWYNIAIMHEQSKWHEAQPSASDEANALLLLSNLGRKHILMARSKAEGPNFLKYWFLSLKFGLKLDNIY